MVGGGGERESYLIYRKLPTGTLKFFRHLPQLKGCYVNFKRYLNEFE